MEKLSIFDRVSIKLARKFGKSQYGKRWPEKTPEWYKKIHDANFLVHADFKDFLLSKKDIKNVLEIGCGKGVYPIFNHDLFDGMKYTGIDISDSAIDYCKQNSSFEFFCGDFIKMDFTKKFDLVFSHAVIDHVYDIESFLRKIIEISNKYVYVNAYRGYFPNLANHKMKFDGYEGCYFNDLSVKKLNELLLNLGYDKNQFSISPQKSGQKEKNLDIQTLILINKNPNQSN